jgi:hypothetical protein
MAELAVKLNDALACHDRFHPKKSQHCLKAYFIYGAYMSRGASLIPLTDSEVGGLPALSRAGLPA